MNRNTASTICPMSLRKDGYDFPQHSADNRKFPQKEGGEAV